MSSSSNEGDVYYPDRPGCVTAYAVLLWLVSGLLALSSLGLFAEPTADPLTAAWSGLFALVLAAIAFGLWTVQAWGWWFVVIIHSLSIIAALFNLVSGMFLVDASGASLSFDALAGGVVSGSILYWFITNRRLFLDPYPHHALVSPEGKLVVEGTPRSKNSNTTMIIVGVLLAVFLVPVCIIAILTLLGPDVGEVFSRITNELSTPAP